MREADFLEQLESLLDATVFGLNNVQKLAVLRELANEYQQEGSPAELVRCRIVPFMTGRRPVDEATHSGLGSSDNASMILEQDSKSRVNYTYILYELTGLDCFTAEELESLVISVTLSFAATDGSLEALPIPGWDKRQVEPMTFLPRKQDHPELHAVPLKEAPHQRLVFAISPEQDLLPGAGWRWEDLDDGIRNAATDEADPFTFGNFFSQMLHVHLQVTHRGIPVASAQSWVDICDTRRFGSLYQRIIDRLIKPDTEMQARKAGQDALNHAYHPWFPVLLIGSDKAQLYTRALVEDIVQKKHHLTDPRWLMRVGLYLEFLTCLGIFEAVKNDIGDLLTTSEREVYESHPTFSEIRKRLNPEGWREVWNLREISFPKFGTPHTGPVSFLNLLNKRKATLAFLHVHHNDLKHAIDLAGCNEYNSQETWHRVFRDAERAVLNKTHGAFPELEFLNPNVRDFVLWHQKGKLDLAGHHLVPGKFSSLFGDQDGLFASACNQYRQSMNEVAEWAKHHRLMDYTGDECIPERVSILRAYMAGHEDQLTSLQRRDGYAEGLYLQTLPEEYIETVDEVSDLLKEVAIFEMLSGDEIQHLASNARRIQLGPQERIIIQGRPGTSLFLVGDGQLEVLFREKNGVDHLVGKKKRGAIVGEFSLLTGEPRSATVRAVEGAIVYEIGKKQYEPIIHSKPQLVDELANLMEEHLRLTRERREALQSASETSDLRHRIRRFFFGS